MIKKIILICILCIILIFFHFSINEVEMNLNDYSRLYFIDNTLHETGSENIITGIYLDYRLFDSVFEASILLITVSGIIFISGKNEDNSQYISNQSNLRDSSILICVSRLLYPLMILFGFYVILNGHISPGGGFQGGAILATAILISYFVDPQTITNLNFLIKVEKFLFIAILIVVSISIFTKGILFTNFFGINSSIKFKRIFLILLNLLIGLKVSLGLVAIFSTFIKEGRTT